RSHADAERKKSIFPIGPGEGANIPLRNSLFESNQPQPMLDLPQRRIDQHVRGPLIAQFEAKGELPGSDRGILPACDPGKCEFGNGARADQPKTGAAQKLTQIGVFDVCTRAQTKFLREQIAQVKRRAPLENIVFGLRERVEGAWGSTV